MNQNRGPWPASQHAHTQPPAAGNGLVSNLRDVVKGVQAIDSQTFWTHRLPRRPVGLSLSPGFLNNLTNGADNNRRVWLRLIKAIQINSVWRFAGKRGTPVEIIGVRWESHGRAPGSDCGVVGADALVPPRAAQAPCRL